MAVWNTVAAVLSRIGLGLDKSISPSVKAVSGTQSRHAQQPSEQKFGPRSFKGRTAPRVPLRPAHP